MKFLESLRSKSPNIFGLDVHQATITHQDVLQGYVAELRQSWPGQDSYRRPVLIILETAVGQFNAELGDRLRNNRVTALRKLSAECSYQFALLESF